jgi:hydrogenase maturation protein HypF
MVANNKPRIIRRSRGYVPQPIGLHIDTEGILATGAELTGTFCIGKGKEAIASQYLGDLQNYENFNFYAESFDRFKQLFRFEPRMLVADMHPDYASSTFAKQFAIQPLLIQHHHAHIASVIAEHQIKEPMLGIAFDGTGYGTDGNIWGSEFLLCSNAEFERIAHFEYVPLPGGDKVILEPWRSALAYMYSYYGKDVLKLNIPFIKNLNNKKATLIMEAIDKKINSPLSCSAGRLFDAVAAITGICTQPTFHAEAPMRLEACIDMKVDEKYDAAINKNIISFKPVIKAIIDDLVNNIPVGAISAKFHNTIIDCILQIAIKTRNEKNINIIALSGGTFQNKYLLEKTENLLQQNLFKVYSNLQAPANDGGIALGQLYLAALKRTENIKR